MKKALYLIISILTIYSGNAKEKIKTIEYFSNTQVRGKNFITKTNIIATEHIFPIDIDGITVDSTTNYTTLILRKPQKAWEYSRDDSCRIVVYDFNNKSVKWSKDFLYSQSKFFQYSGKTIEKTKNKSYNLNSENGTENWIIKEPIFYVDATRKIGYSTQKGNTKGSIQSIHGIDLTTGAKIWEREIDLPNGISDIIPLNDTTLMLQGSGLHTLNAHDGKGWDYKAKTQNNNTGLFVGYMIGGIAAGIFTGIYIIPTSSFKIKQINSNIIKDSSYIYFASKERLVKLNTNGIVKWSATLNESLSSNSDILINGSNIMLINKGYAQNENGQTIIGQPYFAMFNKETGDCIYLSYLEEKMSIIRDYLIQDNSIYIIFKKSIAKLDLKTGRIQQERPFNRKKEGTLDFFIDDKAYIKQDSLYTSLTNDSTKLYCYCSRDSIACITNSLEKTQYIDPSTIKTNYLDYNGLHFLSENNKTIITNNKNIQIAELNITGKVFIYNSSLYVYNERSLTIVPIGELLNSVNH